MINKKVFIFFLFVCFINIFHVHGRQITQVRLGSEWGPGWFAESAVIYRLLPIISYMRTIVLKRIAKTMVQFPGFKERFNSFSESNFKMELRRQYYLWTKGEFIDGIVLSFSVAELFNAGILDSRIEYAKKNGLLDLSDLLLDSLYGLFHILDMLPNIVTEIDLKNNKLEEIDCSDFMNYVSQVKKLDLSYNQVQKLDQGCFDSFSNLEFLDIGHNKILLLSDDIFNKNYKLKGLDLSDNNIKELSPFSFSTLVDLKFLNLSDNKITFLPTTIFSSLKNLKELSLKGNPIRDRAGEKELRKINPKVLIS